MMTHSRWRIFRVAGGLLLVLLLLKCFLRFKKDVQGTETGYAQRQTKSHTDTTIPNTTGCPELQGIHDIMVVLKTGATEALEKVPVHCNTTLKCIPNFIIFSDFEETISGTQIHDVLRSVDENIKQTTTEFDLYNRLRESGRSELTAEDFNDDPSTPSGKPDNRGWLLDKWKFLPMIDETLHARADARWYVFIEADTYVVWPNLLAWLEKFDPSQPYYMGSGVQIVNSVFGHGGSGLVLSHAAAHKVSAYRAARIKEYDDFTAKQWAGDYVLGKALNDAGIGLFFSNPMLQGDTPWTFPYYGPNMIDHWCTPVITYHHMTPNDIRQTWAFEQSWWLDTHADTLLHGDVFKGFIRPQVEQMENWDNASSDKNNKGIRSWQDCQAQCEKDYQCHQFSYEPFRCLTSEVARRGSRKLGISSGWMLARINRTIDSVGSCQKINWIVP